MAADPMNRYTAFKDGAVLMESDQWVDSATVPAGCYVRWILGEHQPIIRWYFTNHNNAGGINYADVPDWVRAWCLIL